MKFTYKNKDTGQVVKRDQPWDSADTSDEWEQVDNSTESEDVEVLAPNGRPRVDQSGVDPQELGGGAPAEDLPGKVPGEVPYLDDMSRSELEEYAAAAGVDGTGSLPNRDGVIAAIRDHEEARAAADDEDEDLDDGDAASDEQEEENLNNLTRAELDERAKGAGVEDPESLPNKDAVVDAIQDAEKE